MKTKYITIIGICILWSLSSLAQQPSCRDIVRPMLHGNDALLDQYPDDKIAWYCAFSRNSFFVSDEAPTDAIVYDISEVKRAQDDTPLALDFVVDLPLLSIYAFDFEQFRFRHKDKRIYFRTPSSSHAYLVLRTYLESLRMTNEETGQ